MKSFVLILENSSFVKEALSIPFVQVNCLLKICEIDLKDQFRFFKNKDRILSLK